MKYSNADMMLDEFFNRVKKYEQEHPEEAKYMGSTKFWDNVILKMVSGMSPNDLVRDPDYRETFKYLLKYGYIKPKKEKSNNTNITSNQQPESLEHKIQKLIALAEEVMRDTKDLHPYEPYVGDRYKISIGDKFVYIEDRQRSQFIDGSYDTNTVFGIKPENPKLNCSYDSVDSFVKSLSHEVRKLYNSGVDRGSLHYMIMEELTAAAEEFANRGVKFFSPEQIQDFTVSFDFDDPYHKQVDITFPEYATANLKGVFIKGVEISSTTGFIILL